MKNKTLLGIPLSSLSWEETEKQIQTIFRGKFPPQQIVTLNNEMLLEAEQNPRFKALLQTTWNLPDGVGLTYLWRFVHGERLCRLPGADLAERILLLAQAQQQSVYLVGGEHIEQPLQDFFRRKFPRLKLLGHQETTDLEPIKKHRPDLLMVCLGAPKQEFLIQDIRKGCPEIKLCIGLGGTFDFWAEKIKRAPTRWRAAGLEWVWRLLQQPSRWRRIWAAVVRAPVLVISKKIAGKAEGGGEKGG